MGKDSVGYHLHTVMDGAEDSTATALRYYNSGGATPMVWRGHGAEALGLSGTVTREAYAAMFGPGGARDPVTGTLLAKTQRPGLELVVRPGKTVSILGVLGRTEDAMAILTAERNATMAYLEDIIAAEGGRRGKGGSHRVPTCGITWAVTRHATSRAGDPDLHDHVLIPNVVTLRSGETRGLDTELLREHMTAATVKGQLAGAWEARQRGYGIETCLDKSGRPTMWRIGGVSRELEERWSSRSREVDDEMGKEGGPSTTSATGLSWLGRRAQRRRWSRSSTT